VDLRISGEPPKLSTGFNPVGAADDGKHRPISACRKMGAENEMLTTNHLKSWKELVVFLLLRPFAGLGLAWLA
jgi:hypothetical protein